MTPHNEARLGDYAATVLMPGDPLRATYIAKNFFTHGRKVNGVRNCAGYTGQYKGQPISVQASGMGQPSLGIYATELFDVYNVQRIIRIGTCGVFDPAIEIGDLIVPLTASSDSRMGLNLFPNSEVTPVCSPTLLEMVLACRGKINNKIHIGSLFSSDRFYHSNDQWWQAYHQAGVLGIDMETHYLYLLAMYKKRQAITINVVSDNLSTGRSLNSAERVTQTGAACELILASLFPGHHLQPLNS